VSQHTPGPWAWQKFGKEWCLTGQHSMRPIVLAVRGGRLTSLVDGLLRPLDPFHPDAQLIASAPDLLRQRDELLAACKMAFDYMCGPSVEELETQGKPIPSSEQVERAIESAIANAEGEKAKAATGVKLRDQS